MQEGSIYTTLSGALALSQRLDSVSNNLANANTTGYKADRLNFEGVLSQAQANRPARQPDQPLTFPVMQGTETDYSQGALKNTGRALDFAIEGEGFFRVRAAGGGTAYTRDGQFQLNSDGVLTDSEGRAVLDDQGDAIRPGSREISLNRDGEIFVPGRQAPVARLATFSPEDAGLMEKEGDNLYRSEPANMTATEGGGVRNGYLERANVNTMEEMVTMMDLQRRFEAMTKAMRTIDETFSESGQRLASPGQ
ncbi:flagellar basal-body rod protein FlgF [Thiohalorhabdus sp.]|uniref:flagellar basal-body rod protein FlgF n=1 Tax=Thiohalorhabdus sp. TaxID=3094134 RepID=UPI002FC2A17F